MTAGVAGRFLLLLVAALSLPFETLNWGLPLGPVKITSLELPLYGYVLVAIAKHTLSALRSFRFTHPRVETLAILSWIAVMLLSAAASPLSKDAFLSAARLSFGPILFCCVRRDLLDYPAATMWLLLSLVAGCLTSTLLGLLEMYHLVDLQTVLQPLRISVTVWESQLRLTGTYQHANMAASCLVMLSFLVLGKALSSRGGSRALWIASAFLLSWGIFLTGSRGGFLGWAAGHLAISFILFATRGGRMLVPKFLFLSGIAIGTALLLSVTTQTILLDRLLGRDFSPHAATYMADSLLVLPADRISTERVEATNLGDRPWRHRGSNPVHIGYHLYSRDGTLVTFEGPRTRLTQDVAPGSSVTIEARIETPEEPGGYYVNWDLVQENVTWFSQAGSPSARSMLWTNATDDPSRPPLDRLEALAEFRKPLSADSSVVHALPPDTLAPWPTFDEATRRDLYSAATKMLSERPLLGVGPGRFRDTFVAYLPDGYYDERLASHNLFLEVATGAGVLGLVTFLSIIGSLASWLVRPLRRGFSPIWPAVGGGILMAFLAHGLIDTFVESYAVMGTFWIALALAGTLARRD